MALSPKLFLSALVQKQLLTQQDADRNEVEALQKNVPIDTYLLQQTSIQKDVILQTKATLLNTAYVNIATTSLDQQALGLIPVQIARKETVLPYLYDPKSDSLSIATTDPLNLNLSDFLERKTGKKIVLALADGTDLLKAIDVAYSQGLSPEVKEALEEVAAQSPHEQQQKETDTAIHEAPIAKIVSTIVEFAMKSRASDIHIEPQETKTRVRYRIDGILQEKLSLPKSIHESLASRIKILSEMKIDERRIPQDGRFNFKLGAQEVDLRVSTLPTVHGEKIVMRLLKKTGGMPTLAELGFRGAQFKDLQDSIIKPNGIILVTGPTGSGKTTTLYSILSILNKPGVNIVTLEDPVEYQIVGINQVQVNPQAGLTFANGLRAFLRQDPNIILVGEIRDKETTQLAIQAALTGHLVFATLHTNDAVTAVPRLIDLGGEPFLISSVLNASVAQRIARKICQHCRTPYTPDPTIQQEIKTVLGEWLPKNYKEGQPIQLYKGNGCQECGTTGYYGRIAIFEVLKVSPALNKMIMQEASAKDLSTQARKEGMIIMKQDGYLKALDGLTTIEEILRIADI